MADPVPSVSAAGVGSRFITQSQVDSINARREEQWKAAYARYFPVPLLLHLLVTCPFFKCFRLGQEPLPRPAEDVYDGRSLAEVC